MSCILRCLDVEEHLKHLQPHSDSMASMATFVLPHQLSNYSTSQIATFLGLSWLLYLICLPIYRLYLSPLAKYPGRKLTIMTPWYEFYYEWVKRGAYIWEIQDMHKQYGPVVRISPRELHIDDPDFYDELFTQRLDKDPWVCPQFGSIENTQATASAELHRSRRAALSPFFSAAKVTQFQSVVTDKIEKLCRLLSDHQREGSVVNMYDCYRALTTDVITEYAFPTNWDFLHRPDLGKLWFKNVEGATEAAPLLRHFPWITPVMDRLPEWLALTLVPDLKFQYETEDVLEKDIKAIMDAGPNVTEAEKQHPTIFYELLYNSNLPESEKHIWRMVAEGALIVIAGNETTGNALNALHFHLLANPEKMARLRAELAEDIKGQWDVPSWQQLKKLPYLVGPESPASL